MLFYFMRTKVRANVISKNGNDPNGERPMKTGYLTTYQMHDHVTGRDYQHQAILSNWLLREMLSNGEYHVISAEMIDAEEYIRQNDKVVVIASETV